MKFEKKYKVEKGFEHLFKFNGKNDELDHEQKMIMFRFLSELERINGGKPIKKSEIAKKIGTSASYITQLFSGDKVINLMTLAKLQEAFNFTYEIKAKDNIVDYKEQVQKRYSPNLFISHSNRDSVNRRSTDGDVYKTSSEELKTNELKALKEKQTINAA